MSVITNKLSIEAYLHCGKCLAEWKAGKAAGQSPKEYARLGVGWTRQGIQVWCNRHECNVIHIDFEGRKHEADTTAPLEETKKSVLKYETTAEIGDRIKAFDHQPMEGRPDRYLIGRVRAKGFSPMGYLAYEVEVETDATFKKHPRDKVFVPFEMDFDYDGRVRKLPSMGEVVFTKELGVQPEVQIDEESSELLGEECRVCLWCGATSCGDQKMKHYPTCSPPKNYEDPPKSQEKRTER